MDAPNYSFHKYSTSGLQKIVNSPNLLLAFYLDLTYSNILHCSFLHETSESLSLS